MRHRTVAFFLAALLLMFGMAAIASPSKEEATASAEAWVALLDSGKYAESWTQASAYFQSRVRQQEWEYGIKAVRAPLGELVSRKVANITLSHTMPGAPDGEYATLKFNTSFKNKESAEETISVAAEHGKWKVAGYFIK